MVLEEELALGRALPPGVVARRLGRLATAVGGVVGIVGRAGPCEDEGQRDRVLPAAQESLRLRLPRQIAEAHERALTRSVGVAVRRHFSQVLQLP